MSHRFRMEMEKQDKNWESTDAKMESILEVRRGDGGGPVQGGYVLMYNILCDTWGMRYSGGGVGRVLGWK